MTPNPPTMRALLIAEMRETLVDVTNGPTVDDRHGDPFTVATLLIVTRERPAADVRALAVTARADAAADRRTTAPAQRVTWSSHPVTRELPLSDMPAVLRGMVVGARPDLLDGAL